MTGTDDGDPIFGSVDLSVAGVAEPVTAGVAGPDGVEAVPFWRANPLMELKRLTPATSPISFAARRGPAPVDLTEVRRRSLSTRFEFDPQVVNSPVIWADLGDEIGSGAGDHGVEPASRSAAMSRCLKVVNTRKPGSKSVRVCGGASGDG